MDEALWMDWYFPCHGNFSMLRISEMLSNIQELSKLDIKS